MQVISLASYDEQIQNYINLKKELQQNILDYLSNTTENNGDSYQIIVHTINKLQLAQQKNDMIEFLHFLVKISNNYYRHPLLYKKIEKILELIKNDMKVLLSETKIFDIFKSNKKLLLFLFEEKIILPNQTIANTLTSKKYKKLNYLSYFYPEMKPFIKEKRNKKKHLYGVKQPEDFGHYYNEDKVIFESNRKIGENNDYICCLIRNDSVIDFISYATKNSLSLKQNVKSSIFETNKFLIKKSPTLIEYATFFGSIQIFKYLYQNGVELQSSLWMYSIHGNNPEIIHFLEENHIQPNENNDYDDCFKEAIKCHHNDIAEYIKNTYLQLNEKKDKINDIQKVNNMIPNDADEPNWCDDYTDENDEDKKEEEEKKEHWYDLKDEEENENIEIDFNETNDNPHHLFFKYYNYAYFDINMMNDHSFYDICKYDYASLFSILFEFSKIKNDLLKLLFVSIEKRNNEIAKLILTNHEIEYNQKAQFVRKRIYEIENGTFDSYDRLFVLEKENKTLLFTAAQNENIEILKILLEKPNININDISIINIWNRKGYEKNIKDYKYFNTINWWINKVYIEDDDMSECRKEIVIKSTALHVSIEKNNLEMVKLLLSYQGIDANLKTIEKMWEYDHTENRRYGNEKAKIKENFPLKTAIIKENIEIIRLLLSHSGIKINEKSLVKKVKSNTEKHIWKNLYIKENEDNLLSIAIKYCNVPALQLLISQPKIEIETAVKRRERSIDYETGNLDEDYYQFHYWRIEKRVKDIKNDYLYEIKGKEDENYYSTEIEEYEKNLFLLASEKGNVEIVKILFSKPEIDIKAKEKDGKTALHIAVRNQYPNIVEFLLSTNKLDINAKTTKNDNKTALHIAVENENLEIIKMLISRPDIDMNSLSINYDGQIMQTAFNMAVSKNRLDICELLLSNPNTDINVKDLYKKSKNEYNGKGPLDIAVSHNNVEMIRLLLSQQKLVLKKSEMIELIKENSKNMDEFVSFNKKYSNSENSAEQIKKTKEFEEIDNLLKERLNFLTE